MERLSPSLEDYMETIYVVKKDLGSVRTKDIAKKLNVSLPSVTEAIQKLSKNNFLQHKKYGKVSLTAKGRKAAKDVYKRHKILLNFFTDTLKVNKDVAEKDACRTEHMLSQVTLNKLTKFLEIK
jgi:DtxR family Mn-dependent transcriptional regulator